MKLSEAIRLGAMLNQQCFGDYALDGKTCAMGAALAAIGVNPDDAWRVDPVIAAAENEWSASVPPQKCPIHGCCKEEALVTQLVVHMNDTHRWTREQDRGLGRHD